jgi:hypothetical protein
LRLRMTVGLTRFSSTSIIPSSSINVIPQRPAYGVSP